MINRFEGKYRFLSNFYPAYVDLDGIEYPSVEHAFQAAKTTNQDDRKRIRYALNAGVAKRIGRGVELRSDWEDAKINVMKDLVLQKFTRHTGIRRALLRTGSQDLVEGNNWGDTFWGICNGIGQNWLGKILMDVRAELKQLDGN